MKKTFIDLYLTCSTFPLSQAECRAVMPPGLILKKHFLGDNYALSVFCTKKKEIYLVSVPAPLSKRSESTAVLSAATAAWRGVARFSSMAFTSAIDLGI